MTFKQFIFILVLGVFGVALPKLSSYIFENLPYAMLYVNGDGADRLNIVGVTWFFGLALYLSFNRFYKIETFKVWIRNLALSLLIIMFFQFATDGLTTLVNMFFGVYPTFPALIQLTVFSIQLLYILFNFHFKGINQFFQVKNRAVLISITVLILHKIVGGIVGVGDFSLYVGYARLWRFWIFYISNYVLITILVLLVLKEKK